MQSLNVVFHVGLNKLLNKPAYDVTVMDDLALRGASWLSAHDLLTVFSKRDKLETGGVNPLETC